MIKEELKQEAEESFEQYKVTDEDYVVSPYSDDMGEKMLMYNYEYYAEETYLRLYTEGYLASAEPREKQIQIDAEQIRALQKQNGELTDELTKKSDTNHQLVEQLAKLNERCSELEDELKDLRESIKDYGAGCYENGLRNGKRKLEAQIEKMRNCANCKNYNGNEGFCVLGSGYGYNCKLEKWEIKEND